MFFLFFGFHSFHKTQHWMSPCIIACKLIHSVFRIYIFCIPLLYTFVHLYIEHIKLISSLHKPSTLFAQVFESFSAVIFFCLHLLCTLDTILLYTYIAFTQCALVVEATFLCYLPIFAWIFHCLPVLPKNQSTILLFFALVSTSTWRFCYYCGREYLYIQLVILTMKLRCGSY